MQLFGIIVTLCLVCNAYAAVEGEWNYEVNGKYGKRIFKDYFVETLKNNTGPKNWKNYYPICGYSQQSPINIIKKNVIYTNTLPNLTLSNYDSQSIGEFEVIHTGFAIVVDLNRTIKANINYGGTTFELVQFHFHWGKDDTRGSEHLVDGKEYPAEVHFVHYNKTYPDFNTALNKSDGLLVWGFIIDVQDSNNTNYDPIINAISKVTFKGNKTTINPIQLDSLLPTSKSNYFTYEGSLTTPGCYESVKWVVNQAPVKMSSAQISAFRNIYSGSTMSSPKVVDTYRPPQPLNGRVVKSNAPVDTSFNFLEQAGWDYGTGPLGVLNWKTNYPICNDSVSNSRQSPIDIKTDSDSVIYNSLLPKVMLKNYNKSGSAMYDVINNGHSIVFTVPASIGAAVTYKGVTYKLEQFHFHWGEDHTKGSEHLIDGKAYQAEVHFVHYNQKYGTLADSVTKTDGLLVNGFFITASKKNNTGFQKLFQKFSEVKYKGNNTNMPYFPLTELLPKTMEKYFTYNGSLTTPNCFESVTWIVNSEIIEISSDQMKYFMDIYKTKKDDVNPKKMMDTYRNPMKLNGRKIYTNVAPYTSPSSSANLFVSVATIVTGLGLSKVVGLLI